jgi:hypothetical protein
MVVERCDRSVAMNSEVCATGRSASVTIETAAGGGAGGAPLFAALLPPQAAASAVARSRGIAKRTDLRWDIRPMK